MRTRDIKPGFYKNDELAECSVMARYIYPGLWMLADRRGRFEDRPKRIKAELLPYDDADMDTLLQELHERGLIIRYCADGRRYACIPKFEAHQKPHPNEKESEIPAPPCPQESRTKVASDKNLGAREVTPRCEASNTKVIPEYNQGDTQVTPRCEASNTKVIPEYNQGDTQVTPKNPSYLSSCLSSSLSSSSPSSSSLTLDITPPYTPPGGGDTSPVAKPDGEGRNAEPVVAEPVVEAETGEGADTKQAKARRPYDAEFLTFWEAYPVKAGKAAAFKAWKKARDRPPVTELTAIIARQKQWPQWLRGYIPHPATWLNQARWADEPPVTPVTAGNRRTDANISAALSWVAKKREAMRHDGA